MELGSREQKLIPKIVPSGSSPLSARSGAPARGSLFTGTEEEASYLGDAKKNGSLTKSWSQ